MVGSDLEGAVARVLADPEVADQSLAALQYDSSVQARTFYGPLVGRGTGVTTNFYASRPLLDSRAGVVFSTGFNPWLFEIDPVRAARQAVVSALAIQAVAGVERRDICLCDNFYTPHLEPASDAWLVAMVDELARLSIDLRIPFISGKDSSAGSTPTDEGVISVPPAVFVTALGKTPDVDQLRTEPFTAAGNLLVLVGPRTPALAGTAAARALDVVDPGGVDDVDTAAAMGFLDTIAQIPLDVAPSGRVIGPGGVIATTFLNSRASGLGAELEGGAALLAEHRCGALLEVAPDAVDRLPDELRTEIVGRVVENNDPDPASVHVAIDGTPVTTPEAISGWERAFEEALR